jgi:hypothetical protein
MSKSQKTFWVGIHIFPIYLMCSLGGKETCICVPSSAPMQFKKCGYARTTRGARMANSLSHLLSMFIFISGAIVPLTGNGKKHAWEEE